MKPIQKSSKLANVLYDVRGPIVDAARQMEVLRVRNFIRRHQIRPHWTAAVDAFAQEILFVVELNVPRTNVIDHGVTKNV